MGNWSIEKILNLQLNMKTLLVIDNATTHKTGKVNDKINKCETESSVIPSGLTWRLQLLDISINKVFKESLRNKYVDYWIGKIK